MHRSQLTINSVSIRALDLKTVMAAYEKVGFINVEFTLRHVYDYLIAGHTVADVVALLKRRNLCRSWWASEVDGCQIRSHRRRCGSPVRL